MDVLGVCLPVNGQVLVFLQVVYVGRELDDRSYDQAHKTGMRFTIKPIAGGIVLRSNP